MSRDGFDTEGTESCFGSVRADEGLGGTREHAGAVVGHGYHKIDLGNHSRAAPTRRSTRYSRAWSGNCRTADDLASVEQGDAPHAENTRPPASIAPAWERKAPTTRTSRFTVTADIVTDIASALCAEDIFARVVRRSAEALEVWECSLYEYSAASDCVTCLASHALEEDPAGSDWVGSSMALTDQPAFSQALHEGRTIATHLDDPGLSAPDRERMEAWGERSCLLVPIEVRNEVIGCFELVEKRHTRVFSTRDRRLAAALAALTAMALQNARLHAEVAELAFTDGLTGLYNHRYFYERLTQEAARAARYALPLSLLMIDIDGFKAYNDRWGHPDGDALLHGLGQLLLRETRAQIDFVARYGGDEFAIIMPSTGEEGAATAAVRLRDAIASRETSPAADATGFTIQQDESAPSARTVAERIRHRVEAENFDTDREVPVTTISIGVAGMRYADSADALVEQADRALYVAKRCGRNRVEVAHSEGDVDDHT